MNESFDNVNSRISHDVKSKNGGADFVPPGSGKLGTIKDANLVDFLDAPPPGKLDKTGIDPSTLQTRTDYRGKEAQRTARNPLNDIDGKAGRRIDLALAQAPPEKGDKPAAKNETPKTGSDAQDDPFKFFDTSKDYRQAPDMSKDTSGSKISKPDQAPPTKPTEPSKPVDMSKLSEAEILSFLRQKQIEENNRKPPDTNNNGGDHKPKPSKEGLVFHTNDYAKAEKEARDRHLPLLVHVGASWCGPCKEMQKNVYPDLEKSRQGKAVFLFIDSDSKNSSAAMAALNISKPSGVPDISIFNSKGKRQDHYTGAPPNAPETLKKLLTDLYNEENSGPNPKPNPPQPKPNPPKPPKPNPQPKPNPNDKNFGPDNQWGPFGPLGPH